MNGTSGQVPGEPSADDNDPGADVPHGVRELLTGPDAPSVPALFAAELRRYRIEAHLTQDELAQRVYCSSGLVSMIETGRRSPNKDFTKRCDVVLSTGGALMRMWPLLTREAYPSWFRPFVEMEATATAIHEFEVQAVPGLLQTADYARTVIGASWPPNSPDETDRQLAARLERQEILDRESPPLLWTVLDEGVLRRPVGTPDVMRAQLTHLLKMAQRQHIRLQILPFAAGVHAAMDGAFEALDLPNREHVVYVEGPGAGRILISPNVVTELRLRLDALRALAQSPADSAAMIADAMGEL